MSIIHNILGMNAQRQYGMVTGVKRKSTEKLSSGYRINRSADDAAGLAISEKMRRQIRGLTQAAANIQDGIGFCQVADGYLNEVHDMMQRMNELAVKSSNGTNTDEDRAYMDDELQQLKKEVKRIFATAEFNEKKIWTVPYLPDVSGEAQDAQVFSSAITSGGESYPGGVEINDVRYNWKELGFDVSEDGRRFSGNQEKEIMTNGQSQDYAGERVVLRAKGDDPVGNVARDYSWKTDGTYIYVNNVRAASLSDIGIKEENNQGEYSFEFRGQTITFEVEDGDSLQDVITGINGDGFYSAVHWEFKANVEDALQPATDILKGSVITATNSNENRFDHVFEITADASGVSIRNLTDPTDLDHEKMAWAAFSGTAKKDAGYAFEEPYEWMKENRDNGAAINASFPIVDWGLDQDDNGIDQVTFDDSVIYAYEDVADLPISFTFDLADETSLEATINGLNGSRFYGRISAPGNTTITAEPSDATQIRVKKDSINENFVVQRALKRNFDSPTESIAGTIHKTYVADEDKTKTTVTQNDLSEVNERNETKDGGTVYYEKDGNYYEAKLTLQINSRIMPESETITEENYAGTYRYKTELGSSRGKVDLQEYGVDREYLKQTTETKGKTITSTTYLYDEKAISADVYNDADESKKQDYHSEAEHKEEEWQSTVTQYYYDGGWHSSEPVFTDDITFRTQDGLEAFQASFTYAGSDRSDHDSRVEFECEEPVTRIMNADENRFGNVADHYSFNESRMYPPKKSVTIQSSSEPNMGIELVWDALNLTIVGLAATNVGTEGAAGAAISQVKYAMSVIDKERSDFGAYQNRLEHAYNVDLNSAENTQAAESKIRDADMAKEMVNHSKANILAQVGESMIAQANQTKQGILNLIQ